MIRCPFFGEFMCKLWVFLSSLMNVALASELAIYDDQSMVLLQRTADQREMSVLLAEIGVRFEQWEASQPLSCNASEEEIRKAYREDIDRLTEENGFQSVDVFTISPDHPKKIELRQKFLNEHTHDEPEVRFFVEGSGLFCLHVDGCVYSVFCEKGDLISIPENYPHWFDMGAEPLCTAIRFFTKPDGWIAHFTGDSISQKLRGSHDF
jgi:1,2-dihydroxy-3-keto-5-methylthiopentene dioxygenase